MSSPQITVKLQCRSWAQLERIYKYDLTRSALFLKTKKPPPIGTAVRINLTLPTESLIVLTGQVARHIGEGELNGRGPGVDLELLSVPHSAMWLIESALSSAKERSPSAVRHLSAQSQSQAQRQKTAPPTVQPGSSSQSPAMPPLIDPGNAGAPTRTAQAPPPDRASTSADRLELLTVDDSADDIPIDDGEEIVGAERELVTALREELLSLHRLTPYQRLGLEPDTTIATIRATFANLTKRYHPDRYARYQSEEAKAVAAEIFILLRNAYGKVIGDRQQIMVAEGTPGGAKNHSTSASRAISESGGHAMIPETGQNPVVRTAPPPVPGAPPPIPQPPNQSQLSSTELFGQGESQANKPATSQPIEIASDRPSTNTGYIKAEGLLSEGKYREANAVYSISARRNPGDAIARAGMELAEGLMALAQGDRMEAAQRFEAVLELDPTNERAARELAEMRRQATNERKGLLARLLGKKE